MEWKIKNVHQDMLIRDYLRDIQGFSRRIVKSIKFDGGSILVNGTTQTVRYRLQEGDRLTVHFPQEKKGSLMQPEAIELSIVYEDEDIVVINKTPGMAVIPSIHHPNGTVANGLLAHYAKQNVPFTVHIVTRLDRDTSGLMLVAKHRYSHSILADSQQHGEVTRKYRAMVEGKLKNKHGTFRAPIARKDGSIIEREINTKGKSAITHYIVEKEFSHYSLVSVQLETGRTHQIRVHFSGNGHPLLGDTLYGGATTTISRQALHCNELSFKHPVTKEWLEFYSELPVDMAAVMKNS
ncbi:RluA family pseudouridine synthase [Virgibacillus sp. AGTR]|uniref:Pseudouridine synthase n=2 Tax=Virgibacillus salarius TaxID=447199 RepID=A0A941DYM1_9BACI|nr:MULTISPECIES: RluA family pseudouridine synthase [Bacillaceae]NAZ10716.1 RluA family pseudouridine synthase [Agaribacter marinus]MBR7798007.1 RluA family pseudouridine synthase [Virgibacillus salarius]MCC2251390.1 RluA family pseudouridine synthase [Virgibacillus sp. AGTR]MDY7046419.1 RluA family pseudouridine synthase [Virgibacillus sp. M23]QRZ16548.1 RluA family pseudouridine synthase [Virgibacillus sp. AGTR]